MQGIYLRIAFWSLSVSCANMMQRTFTIAYSFPNCSVGLGVLLVFFMLTGDVANRLNSFGISELWFSKLVELCPMNLLSGNCFRVTKA